ncbi:helix-turn-helix domain-containing protein [Duganella sp. FT92W]|uniref:Helix-turn-helix domain-containing protein n=1 Tax=Pseudoduganella rivuli TaxID=2666085 RepID=A0A7X2IQ27_9BURK|nr:helix-turn-helix domain-containing protein [Pseudoduganella rivuli]MRV73888.1 helix-turn-helix domain-containing protein [Pseudoduganella rivuli]
MDSLITASARALAAGDPLGALKRVALRDDPPALALRGIAMAQLGELGRARELLRLAARAFGPREAVARARCVVAEAEVALAMRDFTFAPRSLATAAATLASHHDHANALQARLTAARRLVLLGRLAEAEAALAQAGAFADFTGIPWALAAIGNLIAAEIALRALRMDPARGALTRAQVAAQRAGIPALCAEAEEALAVLVRPAARRIDAGGGQLQTLDDVAALLASDTLTIDACRRGLACNGVLVPLASRPVLFALAKSLAEAWPADAEREALIAEAFRTRHPDDTHRARLRVEIGRLRKLAAPLAGIDATARGFAWRPHGSQKVAVLAPPIAGEQASLLALLADGAAWPTSALAQALDTSQRTVQRALAALEVAGRVRAIGQGRSRRWLAPPLAAPLSGFTTILLLSAALPIG